MKPIFIFDDVWKVDYIVSWRFRKYISDGRFRKI